MVLQRLELELAEEEDGWVKHGGNHNLNQSQTPAAVCKIWAPGIAMVHRYLGGGSRLSRNKVRNL
ncbi:hypothetical protein CISG_01209 [Coccidioides immitis RMSCC 3703]|uniref:Uncharacterized protein n=2 Tax=Coccidioides immitis TaxID=5501 RepID=A0A0J8QVI1_COCIT|nr:hypothetical protein CIRG_01687 [Coccidioides immitis RMSCC 2394]KMU76476.1 hypothetical protein CISG_01209 [Coccidioides immitis RMSCC 3703]